MHENKQKAKCRRCGSFVELPQTPEILYLENIVGKFKAVIETPCPKCKTLLFSEIRGQIKKTVAVKA